MKDRTHALSSGSLACTVAARGEGIATAHVNSTRSLPSLGSRSSFAVEVRYSGAMNVLRIIFFVCVCVCLERNDARTPAPTTVRGATHKEEGAWTQCRHRNGAQAGPARGITLLKLTDKQYQSKPPRKMFYKRAPP